jgi:hypothetical protein
MCRKASFMRSMKLGFCTSSSEKSRTRRNCLYLNKSILGWSFRYPLGAVFTLSPFNAPNVLIKSGALMMVRSGFSNFSSSLFIATPACQSLVRRAGRHQDTKFHEGKALTLCYSLCPLSLCGYFSPPHEKLLLPVVYFCRWICNKAVCGQVGYSGLCNSIIRDDFALGQGQFQWNLIWIILGNVNGVFH